MRIVRVPISTSTTVAIHSAVSGFPLTLLSLHLQAAGSVNVKVTDGTNDLTGAVPMASGGHPINWAYNPNGHAQSPAGTALTLNLSGAVAVNGVAVVAIGEPREPF